MMDSLIIKPGQRSDLQQRSQFSVDNYQISNINEDSQIMLDASGSQNKYVNFRIGVSNSENNQMLSHMPSAEASLPTINRSVLRGQQVEQQNPNKKYVNIDFFDWLQNKQLQTGIIMRDQKAMA